LFNTLSLQSTSKSLAKQFRFISSGSLLRTVIYLIIDNAGGHGTNDGIEEYHELSALFQKYKSQLLHQVPNSPETNLLDLGVWRAMQSLFENLSCRRQQDPNVLASTVQQGNQNSRVLAFSTKHNDPYTDKCKCHVPLLGSCR